MYIRYTTESSRRWSVTPDEEAFLAALEAALRQGHKSVALTISRMANGALSVSSQRAYLGKVKLQGRKTWMGYSNIFWHFTDRYWNDFTENGIVLLLD